MAVADYSDSTKYEVGGVLYPSRCREYALGATGEVDVHMWSSKFGDWQRIVTTEPGVPVDPEASDYATPDFRQAIDLAYQGVVPIERLMQRLGEMTAGREAEY